MHVLVIGSGIAGASVAYHLTRRGTRVTVVDAEHPGPATAAGAGIVAPWASPDERYFALAGPAATYYPELITALAGDTPEPTSYEVVGRLIVSRSPEALDATHRRLTARAATFPGVGEVRLLTGREPRNVVPPLAPDLCAVHVSGGARVDGRQIRASLLDAARRRGAEVRTGTAQLGAGRVLVDGEPVGADAVVVAAGAWSGRLVAPLGVDLPVEPQRGQISHLRMPPGTGTAGWPVVSPLDGDHYLLAFPGDRVVVGATRETGSGFDLRITAAGQMQVLQQALTLAPGLQDATLVETRVGFRPLTPDGLPVLGPLPGHPEIVLATGFGPAGLTIAPFAGAVVAAVVLGEEPAVDLQPFRADRFTRP